MSQLSRQKKKSKAASFSSIPLDAIPNLPDIPDQIYFSIGDVASVFQIEPYRLRYWEREFSQLVPLKRSNSRRYYSRDDMYLIGLIKHYVLDEGYTIQGAAARIDHLLDQLSSGVSSSAQADIKPCAPDLNQVNSASPQANSGQPQAQGRLFAMIGELEALLESEGSVA
jgi:DNA-binding transcriptional MerR regulator